MRTQKEWIAEYRLKDALWIHDGNPIRPHALLTSGNHSSGFFNSRLVIPDDRMLRDASADLLELFVQQGGDVSKVQGVVGPQTGATKLAEFMCDQVNASVSNGCFWASPAKNECDGQKLMLFTKEDLDRLRDHSVLLCEDVLTTGGSVDLAATAVTNAGGIVLPFLLVLVNRSGFTEVGGKKIVALIDHPMPIWKPDECPLCKGGSEAVRPKDHWDLLNGQY